MEGKSSAKPNQTEGHPKMGKGFPYRLVNSHGSQLEMVGGTGAESKSYLGRARHEHKSMASICECYRSANRASISSTFPTPFSTVTSQYGDGSLVTPEDQSPRM